MFILASLGIRLTGGLVGSCARLLVDFGESALEIRVICYIDEPGWTEFQRIKEGINLQIMDIFKEYGVELAFPTRTVYFQQAAAVQGIVEYQDQPPMELPHDPQLELPQPDEPESTEELTEEE